jgi:hypothetical protein
MLSSSPRLYIPPESDFVPRFFPRPDAVLASKRASEILTTIFNDYRFVKEWQGDPPTLEDLLQESEVTPAALLDALYSAYARQHGAVRWGDKTPIYTSYIDLIHAIFPRALFVHIIRDGRDVALSTLDKWGDRELHVDVYYAARTWVRRIAKARADGSELGPELYLELKYEDLVSDPELHLHTICDFIGEDYLPAMAEPHTLAREQLKSDAFHAAVREPPTATRIDRWRREMKAADLRLFQRVAGPALDELGYEVADAGPTPLSERARLAALAAKYTVLQTGRRALQALGLYPPI